jgi:hypothetical protein
MPPRPHECDAEPVHQSDFISSRPNLPPLADRFKELVGYDE